MVQMVTFLFESFPLTPKGVEYAFRLILFQRQLDFGQAELQIPQGDNALKADHVFVAVQTIATLGMFRWFEQTDLVVVAQGAAGDSGPLRKFFGGIIGNFIFHYAVPG